MVMDLVSIEDSHTCQNTHEASKTNNLYSASQQRFMKSSIKLLSRLVVFVVYYLNFTCKHSQSLTCTYTQKKKNHFLNCRKRPMFSNPKKVSCSSVCRFNISFLNISYCFKLLLKDKCSGNCIM